MTKLQYHGLTFAKMERGGYNVSADHGKYTDHCKTFAEATSWVWNMAPNHDIGTEFCHRICNKFHCDVNGRKM